MEETKETIEETPKKGSKLTLYLAAFIPILLMLAGFFMVTKFINPRFGINNANANSGDISGDGDSGKSAGLDKSKKHKKGELCIYELDPVLANPLGTQGKRFAKVGICLELSSKSLMEQIDEAKSMLQHQLIIILSSKDIETLTSPAGKSILLEEIRKTMVSQLELTDEDIPHVYFSEFIVQ